MQKWISKPLTPLLPALLSLTPASSFAAQKTCELPTCVKAIYLNPSRTEYAKFNDKYWMVGPKYTPKPLPNSQAGTNSFEPTMVSLHDCSDSKLHCLSGLGSVFAIPKAKLKTDSQYIADGSALKVEKCFRGNAEICQVALISSSCKRDSAGACVIHNKHNDGHAQGTAHNGPTLYFIYNEEVGITAYGESSRPLNNLDLKLRTASQFILNGSRGILAPQKTR
jgi:hypothetical protein